MISVSEVEKSVRVQKKLVSKLESWFQSLPVPESASGVNGLAVQTAVRAVQELCAQFREFVTQSGLHFEQWEVAKDELSVLLTDIHRSVSHEIEKTNQIICEKSQRVEWYQCLKFAAEWHNCRVHHAYRLWLCEALSGAKP